MPVLCSVRVCEALVVPTVTFPNASGPPVTLAIATEIDVYLKLGYKDDALYLWRVFCDYVEEAKEMFENRYEQRLASYTTSATT